MNNIKVTLFNNKKYDAQNIDEVQIEEDESNATIIEVKFPEEYENYSKRVDFMNNRGEKWTTPLYAPEDTRNTYDEKFDKLNFSFTIPTAMAKRGELEVQLVAYQTESNTVVPFQVIYLNINKSILYASSERRNIPDLVIKAYEYANLALNTANESNSRSKHAEDLTTDAAESANQSEESAKKAEQSAQNAETSAKNAESSSQQAQASASAAQTSADQAQKSAASADQRATSAETQASQANTNSSQAVSTANSANSKATSALDIVENLSVSSTEIDCTKHVQVSIKTEEATKHKDIHFDIPAPKQGKSYRAKGPWESTTQYINDEYYIDTVSRHGCTYYCKQTNTNHEPVASDDSEYWGLIAAKGSDAGFTIVDDTDSDHSDYVLSARQGKVLKELIASSIKQAVDNLVDKAPSGRTTLRLISEALNGVINNTTNIAKSDGSVQLGAGTNSNANTLQFKTYQLLDSAGKVPAARLLDTIYPVGSIYLSVNATSPQTLFGGTWEQLKDRFLIGAGSSYSAGSTGGEASHTLSVDEMPSHTHTQNAHNHTQSGHNHLISSKGIHGMNGNGGAQYYSDGNTTSNNNPMYTGTAQPEIQSTTATNQNTGGGKAHNNMPPYLAVYMWKRTA